MSTQNYINNESEAFTYDGFDETRSQSPLMRGSSPTNGSNFQALSSGVSPAPFGFPSTAALQLDGGPSRPQESRKRFHTDTSSTVSGTDEHKRTRTSNPEQDDELEEEQVVEDLQGLRESLGIALGRSSSKSRLYRQRIHAAQEALQHLEDGELNVDEFRKSLKEGSGFAQVLLESLLQNAEVHIKAIKEGIEGLKEQEKIQKEDSLAAFRRGFDTLLEEHFGIRVEDD